MSDHHHPHVDDRGIHLGRGTVAAESDPAVDVLLAGHRVWSFHPQRDAESNVAVEALESVIPWPSALAERLDGVAEVRVVPHDGGEPLFTGTVSFGTSHLPLALVDDAGNPLALDKGNRLQRSFEEMDEPARHELVEAARLVLDDLVNACGLDAYLAYGCLLGAVRDGRMIGHDSDADLAWLSPHTHPFDIIRESRAAERVLRERGWAVVRMSAANFKVWVPLPNGKRAGVDVFGSFHIGDHFHLTGSLRGELSREQILPFTTVDLEGVEFPAPRDLGAFLAFCYGPGWQVPDPAFHFEHAPEDVELMDAWWRGGRYRLAHWQSFHASASGRRVPSEPSDFAAWALERLPEEARVVDLGAGNGRDAFRFAERGLHVTALDFAGSALKRMRATNRSRDLPLLVRPISLESTYNTLVRAAQLAQEPHPTYLYARLLIDALRPQARPGLWRFCAIAGRSGGRTFCEFRTSASAGEATHFGPHARTYADPAEIVAEIERAGGRVLEQEVGRDRAVLGEENPVVCRMQIGWDRRPANRPTSAVGAR